MLYVRLVKCFYKLREYCDHLPRSVQLCNPHRMPVYGCAVAAASSAGASLLDLRSFPVFSRVKSSLVHILKHIFRLVISLR